MALALHDLGLTVIPLLPRSKVAALHGFACESFTSTREDVIQWFRHNALSNIGIVLDTSKVKWGEWEYSVGCFDIDGNALERWKKAYTTAREGNKIPSLKWTCCVKTGNGWRVYFAYSKEDLPDLKNEVLYRGLDDHSEIRLLVKGVTVMPPSTHPNGARYELMYDRMDMQPLHWQEVLALIEAIKPDYKGQGRQKNARPSASRSLVLPSNRLTEENKQEMLREVLPKYTDRKRHDGALRIAAYMRRQGYPLEDTLEFMEEVCLKAGDEEVENRLAAVRDTYRKPLSRITSSHSLREWFEDGIC